MRPYRRFFGTYCLSPSGITRFGSTNNNWPWLGPLVGFRVSRDPGLTWRETPHTPERPLFGETGMWGHPVKIGAPHFVDFGQDMEHSPDGKAYLVATGAELGDPQPRFENLSWITGDQVYLLRVSPSPETINDPRAYECSPAKMVPERTLGHESWPRRDPCSSGTTTWVV